MLIVNGKLSYEPDGGLDSPQYHPRALEVLLVLQARHFILYAISFAALTSQEPGVNPVANAVFGASWPIYPEVLATALQMDKRFAEDLQLKTGSIPLLGPSNASHAQHVKCNVTS
ncbi:hypothetical protein POTOM_016101 [Populus tomentosa]|uniref:Uncharacterized protein n=1 Tax=Populus tomentosa TaxID=118781 RepID=A0A8X8CXP2_POPTO|nr:hypothetical protein POTOM_016101 [Populus tomentosa]